MELTEKELIDIKLRLEMILRYYQKSVMTTCIFDILEMIKR